MAYGFVYALSNPSMPGIYKIGFTLKHPRERMDELSKATACPTPFEIFAMFDVADPENVERAIHRDLQQYRINQNREFFSLNACVLQDAFREYCDTFEGLVQFGSMDFKAGMEYLDYERQWLIDYFHSQSADPIHWPPRACAEGA